MRYVIVKESLWTDAKFASLATDARLLFMWSWMPPHSTVCGLYGCSWKQLERALGYSQIVDDSRLGERVGIALAQLESMGMLRYDTDNEVLWAVNRVKHAPTSEATIRLMQREVQRCPTSPLVDEFVQMHGPALNLGSPTRA